jgi:hypothetical protein
MNKKQLLAFTVVFTILCLLLKTLVGPNIGAIIIILIASSKKARGLVFDAMYSLEALMKNDYIRIGFKCWESSIYEYGIAGSYVYKNCTKKEAIQKIQEEVGGKIEVVKVTTWTK